MAMSSSSSSAAAAAAVNQTKEAQRIFIVVCSNEQAHAQKSKNINLAQLLEASSGVETVVRNLACGDYAVVRASSKAEAASDAAECILLVERKREDDLLASIKCPDKRAESQQQRLEATGVPHIMWLIAPADDSFKPDAPDIRRMRRRLAHLECSKRTGVHHLKTRSLSEFGEWLGDMAHYAPLELEAGSTTTVEIVQKAGAKRKARDPDSAMVQVLSSFPGVSTVVAKAVAARYPTIHKLLGSWIYVAKTSAARKRKQATLSTDAAKSEKRSAKVDKGDPVVAADFMLADVAVNDSGRRVGPAASRLLRTLLFPDLRDMSFDSDSETSK